jgi:large subunit ribosomal protein L35
MRSALRCVGAASLPLRRHLSATLAVPSGAPSPDLPPSTENSQPKLTGGDKLVPPVDATSDTALSPTLKKRRGKPRVYVRGRPLVSARVWNRPLAQGVLPVYDEALKIIRQDSAALKVRAYALGGDICAAKKAGLDKRDEEALSSMKTQTEKLELESEMNLPRVRWAVANGMGESGLQVMHLEGFFIGTLVDMSKPVHRHLVEQKWRKEGALDLLVCLGFLAIVFLTYKILMQMERIHQMHVIPDVLPDLRPSVDLRVAYRKISVHLQPGTRRKHAYVEPGIFLLPEQVRL